MTQTPNDKDINLDNALVMFGNALERLKDLPDNSVDSIVTDPPYGLSDNKYVAETITKWIEGERTFTPDGKGFMGKAWDSFVPPPAIWDECLRVLKPGGHLLAFFGSRTQDIGALAIRLAGFEIRDSIAWLYGSGFPKSLDISKAIDKQAGAERKVVSTKPQSGAKFKSIAEDIDNGGFNDPNRTSFDITSPATDAAKQWEGWGTALKPAHEPIVVARKPISESTVANNVLLWGTGGLNIDASRVGGKPRTTHSDGNRFTGKAGVYGKYNTYQGRAGAAGRFPANLILSHSEDCVDTGETRSVKTGTAKTLNSKTSLFDSGKDNRDEDISYGIDGEEALPVYRCVPGCPVAELDRQSGVSKSIGGQKSLGAFRNGNIYGSGNDIKEAGDPGFGDTGGASRFFYVAKASKKDRNEGLDSLEDGKIPYQNYRENLDAKGGDTPFAGAGRSGTELKNFHPTVKPTALMEYLVRLVTPEGGTVLDPFTGSGSTGKAALLNGFKFIGCELTEDYLPIIEGRLTWAQANREKYQAEKVAAAQKASKASQKTPSKAVGGDLTALDAAEVALQQLAAKKAKKTVEQTPLFDEVEINNEA